MKLQCPHCLKQMDAGQELPRGQRVECPFCAKTFSVDTGTVVKNAPAASAPAPAVQTKTTAEGVKIVGISIPFLDMVMLLVEIALASIPALLLIYIVFYAVFYLIGRIIGGL